MNTISKLLEKLKDREYRRAFVASQINIGIPLQIRALMKAPGRDWTQKELAARTGMLQPRISAMLKPGATRPNIETLRRLADAFDCGLQVRFVPFTELVTWSQQVSPDTFGAPDYESEAKEGRLDALAIDRKPPVEALMPVYSPAQSAGGVTAFLADKALGGVTAKIQENSVGSPKLVRDIRVEPDVILWRNSLNPSVLCMRGRVPRWGQGFCPAAGFLAGVLSQHAGQKPGGSLKG